jgi:hypothetical protein
MVREVRMPDVLNGQLPYYNGGDDEADTETLDLSGAEIESLKHRRQLKKERRQKQAEERAANYVHVVKKLSTDDTNSVTLF